MFLHSGKASPIYRQVIDLVFLQCRFRSFPPQEQVLILLLQCRFFSRRPCQSQSCLQVRFVPQTFLNLKVFSPRTFYCFLLQASPLPLPSNLFQTFLLVTRLNHFQKHTLHLNSVNVSFMNEICWLSPQYLALN